MSITKPSANERILQTAHDLFYRDGIRATGIDKIIKQAGVTKVTFYRHFPSKDDLVRAFLEFRHERWMSWFSDSLAREMAVNNDFATALCATLKEWFCDDSFRGCAFINTAVELADALPESLIMAQSHKQKMVDVLAQYLADSDTGRYQAEMIAMLIDGAIVKAQRERQADAAVKMLGDWLNAL
ncbi:TetR/AcrR family transcriptional regulator [Buttiauxella sp. B2]|uniref:TetR/AcrR family transcriptional regulator n=1 Tax=Buttiauxella sp. B2 TaxID=2587812 RepID=UPI0011211CAF|nr:TetR/AcrR family transcriptional regulator [Buttiauxella sp. B2]TNV21540.1 TetR/AcrR family transcriptional regulator [Buttiauxella sp. B2]